MMKGGRSQDSVSPTLGACVSLPTWQDGRAWRSLAKLGREGSQSWARESSAEGLHQLHCSIVLEKEGGKDTW